MNHNLSLTNMSVTLIHIIMIANVPYIQASDFLTTCVTIKYDMVNDVSGFTWMNI